MPSVSNSPRKHACDCLATIRIYRNPKGTGFSNPLRSPERSASRSICRWHRVRTSHRRRENTCRRFSPPVRESLSRASHCESSITWLKQRQMNHVERNTLLECGIDDIVGARAAAIVETVADENHDATFGTNLRQISRTSSTDFAAASNIAVRWFGAAENLKAARAASRSLVNGVESEAVSEKRSTATLDRSPNREKSASAASCCCAMISRRLPD